MYFNTENGNSVYTINYDELQLYDALRAFKYVLHFKLHLYTYSGLLNNLGPVILASYGNCQGWLRINSLELIDRFLTEYAKTDSIIT
jgi:hypothetical protein